MKKTENEPVGKNEVEFDSRTRGVTTLVCTFVVAIVLLVIPNMAFGQVLYGSLTGNVSDPTGAALPGAKVEAVNINTGTSRETTTNESGVYQFSNLQVGIYKVTVSLASFKTLLKENIVVEANMVRRFDAQLEVGEVRETVVVTSDSNTTLQTDKTDVNVTQTTRQVNDLPLTGSLGRNYQSLMTIVPGAVSAGEQNSVGGNPQRSISFNVNGVSRMQNNTRIDGAGVVYPWLPTNTVYVPPAESIQEVNIVTNSFDAEQGLAGGAAINLTIKSGANEFHGAGWGYDTNSRFLSRSFFQPANQVKIPKNILAQYGYSVSGPIIKDKLFFFTDLERTTQRITARTTLFSIAPASLRPDANGNVIFPAGTIIYDPLSNPDPRLRTPFPNNMIPANRIDIAALELIKRLPLPNVCATCTNNNFAPTGVGMFNRTNFDVKINYIPNERLTMFGRYSISPTIVIEPPIFGEAGGDALNGGQNGTAPSRIQVAGIGGTYTFNSNVVLDANIGYTRQRLGAQDDNIGKNIGLDILRIPGTNGPDPLQGGVPSFQISNWANLGNPNTGNPFLFRDNQYLLASNLSWLKGTHSFRFGLDYQNQQLNHFQPQGGAFQTARGTFVINGNATALQSCNAINANTPSVCNQPGTLASPPAADRFNSWAAFLLGLPTGTNSAGKVTQLRNPNALYMQSYALYARDHWQITRSLTLTYGLRWERYPFPTKDNSGINRFDPADGNVYTGGLSGVPRNSGAESGPGQFLPRVGIAYRLNDKTVLRGGYGQSADPRPFIDFRNAYPIVNNLTMAVPTFGGSNNNFLPVTTFRLGLIAGNPPDLTQGIIRLPANTNTSTYPKTPMRKEIHSWNFIIERELPWQFAGQIGYVGTRAVGQMGFININASAPGTGDNGRPLMVFGINADVNSIEPYGTATYDAMQAKLERRFAGSILGAVYTWSKAINYADNDANPRIQYKPEKERNRGLAGYDRTHNFQGYLVYDLPFGKGKQWMNNSWISKLVGGWQINGIVSVMNGAPFYVIQNTAGGLLASGSGQVPNQINPVVAILGGIGTPSQRGSASGRYFDVTAFAPENGARFGSAGRNNLRGPGFFNIDMGIFRTISIRERIKFQLRAEALNALNHANFANPQSNISDPSNFGYINATTGQASRQWRFGARVSF